MKETEECTHLLDGGVMFWCQGDMGHIAVLLEMGNEILFRDFIGQVLDTNCGIVRRGLGKDLLI